MVPMAAEQGKEVAQFQLALLYSAKDANGKTNYQEAVKWYRKAAEQGHAKAQLMLGICYSLGNGVEKNMDESLKWIRKAASQGDEDAKEALKRMGK